MKTILFVVLSFLASTVMATGIIGTWTYEAPNAPVGYEKGEVAISKTTAGDYKLVLIIGTYEINAEKVKVKDNSVSCQINVEGASIPLSFTFEEDSFSGKADTPDGYVMINGTRKVE